MSDILKAATPFTCEEHELSTGFSAIIYDKNGAAIDGHNSLKLCEAAVKALNSYELMLEALEAAEGCIAGLIKSLGRSGESNDLIAEMFPNSKRSDGQPADETARRTRRELNEGKAVLAAIRSTIALAKGGQS